MSRTQCIYKVCFVAIYALGLLYGPQVGSGAQNAAPVPKMQFPADQRAFEAAKATTDPEKRLEVWRQFITNYSDSLRVVPARSELLQVLIKNFPERTGEIQSVAEQIIEHPAKGEQKWDEEYYVAGLMAEAQPDGVDLPQAEKWAKKSVDVLTENHFNSEAEAADKLGKIPPPTPEARHRGFAKSRSLALASLANVYLDEGKLKETGDTLAEAYTLAPSVSKISLLQGRLALLRHSNAEALDDFERAQLLGELRSPWREDMMDLYRKAHAGSDAGFIASMDVRYTQMFPAPFNVPRHASVVGGHTVLFELFTGSACKPCVAGDLAMEQMLKAYPRTDLVALSVDEHIPKPDPLANPDTVARAALFNVFSTPTYVIDGTKATLHGGTRKYSEEIYGKLTKLVDAQLVRPSPVQIQLNLERETSGIVRATAIVDVGSAQAVLEDLAPLSTGSALPVAAKALELMANFALVEDDVRYPGENGIRFHRMVVRSYASPAASGQAIALGRRSTVETTFDLSQISEKLAAYLTSFETDNDKFGKVEFLSKDTTIDPNHLAVAVWVQDSVTHHVLQAAFLPVAVGK